MEQKHRQRPLQHESIEQQHLFQWAGFMSLKYPELKYMYHIPNGGSRNPIEAVNLKKQGVKAGVPDICLPVPSGDYNGLYIELKYGKNKTTKAQDDYINFLNHQGYAAVVCYGWEQAVKVIEKYLKVAGG